MLLIITVNFPKADLTGLSLQGASSSQLVKDEYGIRMDCEVSGGPGNVGEPSVTPGPSGLTAIQHPAPGTQSGPAPSQVCLGVSLCQTDIRDRNANHPTENATKKMYVYLRRILTFT